MSDYYEHLEAAWNDLSKEDKEKFISSNIRQQQFNPSQDKEDGEDELWYEAAKQLFKRHNPFIRIDSGIGQKLLNGFIKDMDELKSKFHITRKTPNQ